MDTAVNPQLGVGDSRQLGTNSDNAEDFILDKKSENSGKDTYTDEEQAVDPATFYTSSDIFLLKTRKRSVRQRNMLGAKMNWNNGEFESCGSDSGGSAEGCSNYTSINPIIDTTDETASISTQRQFHHEAPNIEKFSFANEQDDVTDFSQMLSEYEEETKDAVDNTHSCPLFAGKIIGSNGTTCETISLPCKEKALESSGGLLTRHIDLVANFHRYRHKEILREGDHTFASATLKHAIVTAVSDGTRCVIIFAIPLRKRDSFYFNQLWNNAQLVEESGSRTSLAWDSIDFCNMDRIFTIVMPRLRSSQRFIIECPDTGDVDRPGDEHSYYTADWNSYSIYSLRDGVLVPHDQIFDIGITLIYAHAGARLHYWDEVSGFWNVKEFVQTSNNWGFRDDKKYACIIPSVRRCIFVVEKSLGHFIKKENHFNLLISFSGCYEVFDNGTIVRYENE